MSLLPLAVFESPLVGSNPFNAMRTVMRAMDTELDRLFPDASLYQSTHSDPSRPHGRAPSAPSSIELDILETPTAYILHADLPGLAKDQVKLHFSPDHVLTVSGERAREEVKEGNHWRRVERSFGKFQRSVKLPESVNPAGITAKMDKGVLEIVVPKRQEEERKVQEIAIE